MSDNTLKYIAIIAIFVSVLVGIYVYREMSNTRAKLGEMKFLKNQFINIETKLCELEENQARTLDCVDKIGLSNIDSEAEDSEAEDSEADDSSEYEVYESEDNEVGEAGNENQLENNEDEGDITLEE